MDELLEAIVKHRKNLASRDSAGERERMYLEKKLKSETERFARGELWNSVSEKEIDELVDRIAAGKTTPYKAAHQLLDRFVAGRRAR